MTRLIYGVMLISSLGYFSPAVASIDVYDFSSEDNRHHYNLLTKELRCPKCQNQDIADSNAPIAQDMRREVHRLVEEGKTPELIVAFMVERFGEFVSYKPKVIPATYVLWFGPAVLVIFGLIAVLWLGRRKKGHQTVKASSALNESDKQRLDSLLQDSELNSDSEKKENN